MRLPLRESITKQSAAIGNDDNIAERQIVQFLHGQSNLFTDGIGRDALAAIYQRCPSQRELVPRKDDKNMSLLHSTVSALVV
ncbi:hypothetical protein BLI708_11130 [Bifidobacterium imperatoris]|uniref:Uncharacterized protein n=1 Tax=Bifidobacterium imperatoris TaxID=2020965 RepID=A0ABX7S3E7_9BIFI|nr:hypothetical protein [Bifidobacterium imperatoris]QSY57726.1 hypothetical protein BLI708_11130 [Bifidobacterium imperatoris]